jgi:cytochrome c oxidase subunit 1
MALASQWLYFFGVLIMARGLISGGIDGMPRRTNMLEATYGKPTWEMAGMLTGLGGTLMFVGGAAFFLVFAATLFFGKKTDNAGDIPFTETATAPAARGWEVKLDSFKLWMLAAVVLVLVAYGPFFVQYLPAAFTAPGHRFY